MKKIFKNLTLVLLMLMMLMSLVPVSVFAAADALEEDYELRVLTFENEGNNTYWSSLIDEQYGGKMLYGENWSGIETVDKAYKWQDAGYTELAHTIPFNYGGHYYWGGGHAISNYATWDFET